MTPDVKITHAEEVAAGKPSSSSSESSSSPSSSSTTNTDAGAGGGITTFPQFSTFPQELQDLVWEQAITDTSIPTVHFLDWYCFHPYALDGISWQKADKIATVLRGGPDAERARQTGWGEDSEIDKKKSFKLSVPQAQRNYLKASGYYAARQAGLAPVSVGAHATVERYHRRQKTEAEKVRSGYQEAVAAREEARKVQVRLRREIKNGVFNDDPDAEAKAAKAYEAALKRESQMAEQESESRSRTWSSIYTSLVAGEGDDDDDDEGISIEVNCESDLVCLLRPAARWRMGGWPVDCRVLTPKGLQMKEVQDKYPGLQRTKNVALLWQEEGAAWARTRASVYGREKFRYNTDIPAIKEEMCRGLENLYLIDLDVKLKAGCCVPSGAKKWLDNSGGALVEVEEPKDGAMAQDSVWSWTNTEPGKPTSAGFLKWLRQEWLDLSWDSFFMRPTHYRVPKQAKILAYVPAEALTQQ